MRLEVRNLSKTYYLNKKEKFFSKNEKVPIQALNNVSFVVNEGEICGLIGLNGAGKSTLIKIISGVLKESQGEFSVFLGDKKLSHDETKLNMSLVFGHRGQLWQNLSIFDSYKIIGEIYGIGEKTLNKRINYLVELLELENLINRQARQLSLGQKMKCEIAGALINKPKLLLLDEPTLGLDVLTKNKIFRTIKEIHKNENTTIIFTSHDLKDVGDISKKMLILNKGKLIFDGDIDSLNSKYNREKKITISKQELNVNKEFMEEKLDRYKEFINRFEIANNDITILLENDDNFVSLEIVNRLAEIFGKFEYKVSSMDFSELIEKIYQTLGEI